MDKSVLRVVLVAVWQKRYSVDHAVDELCGRRNGDVRRGVTIEVERLHDHHITVKEAEEEIGCILDEGQGAHDAT